MLGFVANESSKTIAYNGMIIHDKEFCPVKITVQWFALFIHPLLSFGLLRLGKGAYKKGTIANATLEFNQPADFLSAITDALQA